MEDVASVRKISHFYYCLLMNILIRKTQGPVPKGPENARMIKRWLNSAKQKKLFDPLVCHEINWLLEEVDKYSALQFEERIERIYVSSKKMTESAEFKG